MPKDKEAKHGKKANQKLKPYLVMQYLLKNSDENHLVTAPEIVSYLENDCGIEARHGKAFEGLLNRYFGK